MKKLEMIIRQEKLEDLKSVLSKLGINGITVSSVLGCGNQKGKTNIYRGNETTVSLLHKIKAEVVVAEGMVKPVIREVLNTIDTGSVGDGKIFVLDITNAIRISTGEEAEEAI